MYLDVLTNWMEQYTTLNNLRGVTAGVFFVLDLILVGVFLLYATLNYNWRATWRENDVIRGAMALATYFFGQVLIRVWAWGNLRIMELEDKSSFDYSWFWLYIVGTIISLTGVFWIVNVLTPPRYKPWNWVVGGGIGLMILWLTRN
jgi:uncharacterized BrkB/YihY/UPF0761 family membrane protein